MTTAPPETPLSPIPIGAILKQPVYRQPAVLRLLVVALLAEIGYAVLNISTMQVYLRDDRKFGTSVISLVFVAFLLSEALLKGPMGQLADKYGHRKLMTIGPVISVFTSLISLVVPKTGGQPLEVFAFVLLRALDGIGAAMLWPAAFALMGNSVSEENQQSAMSYLNLCYMLGIALALPIGGIINDVTGTHWASLILSAVLFGAVALSSFFLIKESKSTAKVVEGESVGVKELLSSLKQIPAYLLLAGLTFTGFGFPMTIIKLFAADQFKMSETQFGALVFPAAITMAALGVPMSKLGERIGKVRSIHLGMGLASAGLWLIAAGAFFPFLRLSSILVLASLPIGLGFLLAIPAWMTSVSDINPARRGANLGAVMTAQGIGAMIGASIGGVFYEKFQPLGHQLHLGAGFARYSPFVGCAVCITLGWLVGLRILRADPKAQDRTAPTLAS